MNQSSWIACKYFIEKFSIDLEKLLPQNIQHFLEKITITPTDEPLIRQNPIEELLSKIHISWFSSYLRTLAEADILLFLSALPHEKSEIKKLESDLGISSRLIKPSKLTIKFLQQTIYNKIVQKEDFLPIGFLPSSELIDLIKLSNAKLMQVISFLGLYDLAFELRQVIDTAKLKSIFSLIGNEEKIFIQKIFQEKFPATLKRINLNNIENDKDILHNSILKSGIDKLGKALFGQNDSFIWHICHSLEVSIATVLKESIEASVYIKTNKVIISQIIDVLDYVKKLET